MADISSKEKYINLLVAAAGISGPKTEPEEEDASELKEKFMSNESFSQWSDTFNSEY